MAKIIATCLFILQLIVQVPAYAQTSTITPPLSNVVNYSQYQLTNGLKVIVVETPAFPVISSLMWYRAGSRNEVPGKTGVAHLLEHLLFGNTGSFKKDELAAAIVRNGGQFNGYTSDDFICFFETLPSSKLELALKIEAERMRGAKFTEADVKEAQEEINDELDDKVKDPLDILAKEVRAMSFLRHPYRNPTIGWKSDIAALKLDDAKDYYDRYFWPNNATLVIAGDIKAEATKGLVEKYFGQIPSSPSPITEVKVTEPLQRGERQVKITQAGKQEIVQIAYHCPSAANEDAAAFVVLEQLLNAQYSGRLHSKFAPTKLCTSAFANFESHRDPSIFNLTGTANPGVGLQKVLDGFDSVIAQLKSQLCTDAELKRARQLAEFAFNSECDGPYRLGFHAGFFDVISPKTTVKNWPEELRSVTSSDIQRIARQYLVPENRVVGFLETPQPLKLAPQKQGQADAPKSDTKPDSKVPPATKPIAHLHLTGFKLNNLALRPLRLRQAKTEAPQTTEAKDPASPSKVILTPADDSILGGVTGDETAATTQPATANATQTLDKPPVVEENWIHRLKHRTLKNGLKVAVLETHISPIVQIKGAIYAGQIFDPTNKKGLSTLTASLMNAGNAKRNQQQLRIAQEDLGLPPSAMLSFDCQRETLGFETACLSRNLSQHLSFIAESLTSPTFVELDVEKARQEVVASLKQTEGSLPSKIERAALRNLIASNSAFYPQDPLSLVRTVAELKATDVKTFFEENVTASNTAIVFVGDITIDEACNLTERALGTWPSKKPPQIPLVRPSSRKVLRTSIPTSDPDDARICWAKLLDFSQGNRDYPHLLLADCALASHPLISRLVTALSKDSNLGQIVSSGTLESQLDPLTSATTWSLSVSVPPEAVSQLVTTVRGAVDVFSKGNLTAAELSECRRYLLGSIPVRSLSTIPTIASTIRESMVQGCEPTFVSKLLGTIRTANIETIGRFVRNNFKPDQSTLIMTGDGEAIKAISRKLSIN